MPINITQESYDKVKQVGHGPNAIRKYKKPRLEGPQLSKDPQLLGLDEPIVITNPDPPPPEHQPRILFSGGDPRKHAKVNYYHFKHFPLLFKECGINVYIFFYVSENTRIGRCSSFELEGRHASCHGLSGSNDQAVVLSVAL